MYHSRILNNKINRTEERALLIVYNAYKPNFKELLRHYSSTFYERNIQYIPIEFYKIKNDLFPVIMTGLFQFGKYSAYELRSDNHLQKTNIQTVHFSNESVKTLGAKILYLIPTEIKVSKSLIIFKEKVKNWTGEICPCRLYRIYFGQAVKRRCVKFFEVWTLM